MKWPNDILTRDGAKLAGILCEAAPGPGATFVIAGIGINVLQPAGGWHGIVDATSIEAAAGVAPSRADLAGAIVDALREYGVRDIEMPATPYRVWSAIREARAG